MMKFTFTISLLVFLCLTQTVVYPNTNACQCKDLQIQADCTSKNECQWVLTSNDSQLNALYPTQMEGTCILSHNREGLQSSSAYCGNFVRYSDCSSTKGCAFVDKICTNFSGCSAYVYKTNAACQSISKQCTTDGERCVNPTSCQKYLTQELCKGNVATSGAKACLWITDNGTCINKVCSDAPKTFKTQEQCKNWIEGCFSNGIGCTTTLEDCSTYKQINRCYGMIGFDGPCFADPKSTKCRNLACTDAPLTYSTNKQCDKFLKGCLTDGKGCVAYSQFCNTYNQTKGCTGLLGNDGPCTKDRAKGSIMCRSLACTDAPASLITNEACSKFIFGCITTGLGCTRILKPCSSYKGTITTCFKYLGLDGKCQGTSDLETVCSVRLCSDASSTNKTDAECNSFQQGCISTGAGCTQILGLCSSYKGTAITCTQYLGTDGNCTAPANQQEESNCVVKKCKDALMTTTNAECKAFSHQCQTDGTFCIEPQICEQTINELSCQGNSACVYNQVCLNRSSCNNYNSYSLCLLNQQQYFSGGIVYLRNCLWNSLTNSCSNLQCSSLSKTLATDAACSEGLQGCLTKGFGCVDVSDSCTSYAGLIAYCYEQRGINGSQLCTQLSTVSDQTLSCVARNLCQEAKTYSIVAQTSDETCHAYLPNCFYDGMDNCTNRDCTTYFGTQVYCAAITTARIGKKLSKCWKTINLTDTQTPCEVKYCLHALPVENYQTDIQCNEFLAKCISYRNPTLGCMPPSIQCYSNLQLFSTCTYIQNNFCQKKVEICRIQDCKNIILPSKAITAFQQGVYYQGFKDQNGYNCLFQTVKIALTSCTSFVAVGIDYQGKILYCYGMIYSGNNTCGYRSGENCAQAVCDQFLALGETDDLRATYCQSLRIDGIIQCGLALRYTYCQTRRCDDYGIVTKTTCIHYISSCRWNELAKLCYEIKNYCGNSYIATPYMTSEILKAQYCNGIESTSVQTKFCDYEYDFASYVCCQSRNSCKYIKFPVSVESDFDRAKFCVSQKQSLGFPCAYIISEPKSKTCVNVNLCINYDMIQASDVANKIFCQIVKNKQQQNCCFTANPIACSENNNECSSYDTYGTTLSENQSYCSQIVLNDTITCASNNEGVSKCKYPVCSDVLIDQSFQTCKAYNKICTFNGSACINVAKTCAGYIAQIVEQQVGCARLITENETRCGWTSGMNCSDRVCAQLQDNEANFVNCKDYAIGCLYNGMACVDTSKICSSYEPLGLTDLIKAAICNQMIDEDGKNCTFMIGSNSCIDTRVGCDYLLPESTDDANKLACSMAQDQDGISCQFTTGDTRCSTHLCQSELVDLLNSDCNPYFTSCYTGYTQCSSRICNNAPLYKSQSECTAFRDGCLSKGSGCVEPTDDCSFYQGTQSTCQRFIGNGIFCTNTINAVATKSCISKTCNQNLIALNDNDCAQWYPSQLKDNCVWGGTLGCVTPQPCSSFIGTVDSCPRFTATNGPCYGTGSDFKPAMCSPNTSFCQGAPKTFNTDAKCKTWGSTCMTNGQGCITIIGALCSNIISPIACNIYSSTDGLYCNLANQCRTKPSTCEGLFTASECNNILLLGSSSMKCGWDASLQTCIPLNCSLLPVTLTTDIECSAIISTCTTNSAGCVTKGPCSSYSKQACIPAATTDIQKQCIWLDSECRPIKCTDNKDATSDMSCNSYLAGCKTSGNGCFQTLTCQNFTQYAFCLIDSAGYPCLWYKLSADSTGVCVNYENCTDIIKRSHIECQAASALCTTNGVNCIAITGCSLTLTQESCIIGTDGICGWLPEAGLTQAGCQIYTNCQDALGKTTVQCQAWGKDCQSDGNGCIQGQTCKNYETQIACENPLYGSCSWVTLTATCRDQICSDAPIAYKKHSECVQFPASTACTASETTCIEQKKCDQYKIQAGSVHGTDGYCFWDHDYYFVGFCRLDRCSDLNQTQCHTTLNCVSQGSPDQYFWRCIEQSTCLSYTYKSSCSEGGTDGACSFKCTNTDFPDKGSCTKFSQCSSANFDETACNSRSDACQFINDDGIKQCSPHTCASKAQGSSCQPVPSLDLSSYQICVQIGQVCAAGNPSSFTSSNCFHNSVGTYYWNITTQPCTSCNQQAQELIKNTDLVHIVIVIALMI